MTEFVDEVDELLALALADDLDCVENVPKTPISTNKTISVFEDIPKNVKPEPQNARPARRTNLSKIINGHAKSERNRPDKVLTACPHAMETDEKFLYCVQSQMPQSGIEIKCGIQIANRIVPIKVGKMVSTRWRYAMGNYPKLDKTNDRSSMKC